MKAENYFKPYKNYFWQVEEDSEVLAIPNGNTIAYTFYVAEVLGYLLPQGLPPFGSLILAFIATNPNGKKDIESIFEQKINKILEENITQYKAAKQFLNTLVELPQEYKTKQKRILLFQTVFYDCHNRVSPKDARLLLNDSPRMFFVKKYQHIESQVITKNELSRDLKVLELLCKKYPTTLSIIQKMAGLQKVEEAIETVPILDKGTTAPQQLVKELVENTITFKVGALIKQLWSGLHLPLHSTIPSGQPLGGISDLTNKGDFDRLLISEYANDETVFMSRLANNEALYIQREVPPSNNTLERIILVDVSIKNWGVPKTIAYGVMLAIAKHPKTDIVCKAYAVGEDFYELDIRNIDNIIEGLQHLDPIINPAKGIELFFKHYPFGKNREVFLITESSIHQQAEMQKVVDDYRERLNYHIYTNVDGKVEVYQNKKNNQKHLQTIQLPLGKLWTKKHRPQEGKHYNRNQSNYPILFRKPRRVLAVRALESGELIVLTKAKSLFISYEMVELNKHKGWDLLYEDLPAYGMFFEVGKTLDGVYVVFSFDSARREGVIINVETKQEIRVPFDDWRIREPFIFIYEHQKFYYNNYEGSWELDLNGERSRCIDYDPSEVFSTHNMAIQQAKARYGAGAQIFRKIHTICITGSGHLLFNIHQLIVNNHNRQLYLRVNRVKNLYCQAKEEDGRFIFSEGSTIEINVNGMFILKSSNLAIPTIYIVSTVDEILGAATEEYYAGANYYYKNKGDLYELTLVNAGNQKLSVVKEIKEHCGVGLKEAKEYMDAAPFTVPKQFSEEEAVAFKEALRKHGAGVRIAVSKAVPQTQQLMEMPAFYKQFISKFITHIMNHGTDT